MPAPDRVAGLRKVLLVFLVLFLALLGLFLFGRSGQPDRGPEAAEEELEAEGSLVLAGEGFDYQATHENRPLFRVRASRILSRREPAYSLEDVALTYFREDGARIEVAGRRGTYDLETEEARLEGGTRVVGPDGTMLETEELRFERGRWLLTSSPVRFRFAGRFTGQAQGFRVNLQRHLFHLLGGVSVRSLPGEEPRLMLRTPQLTYERDQHLVRADGGVVLERGEDRLRAVRVTAHLTPSESRVRFIRGRRDVSGRMAVAGADGPGRTVDFQGNGFSLLLEPSTATPKKVELEGRPNEPTLLVAMGAGEPERRLTAGYLVGTFAGGELTQIEAFPPVRIIETPPPPATPRRVIAQKATVTFGKAGEMEAATLTGGVTYHGPDGLVATGALARLEFASERAELLGDPARAVSPRGELAAPRIVRLGRDQLLHAQGGVEALLREEGRAALAAGPLGEGSGPVRVAAQEAFWSEGTTESFLFRGSVRAWQGENLLLAPELRGEVAAERLTASGGVKTLWEPEERVTGGAAAGDSAGAGATGEPIEVTAERLTYDGLGELLRYEGDVRIQQAGRTLRCQEAEAELAEGEIQTMVCIGRVRIDDPQTARSVEGQRAIYRVESGEVTVTGEPVTLRDRDGAQVRGRLLVYDLETGVAQMRSDPAEGAPTAEQGEGAAAD